jgi:amidophosphoribosyltransferase
MSEIHHECGVAAVYHLPGEESTLCPGGPENASRLLPRMLQDIQNRGQLAAGMSSFHPGRDVLIATH